MFNFCTELNTHIFWDITRNIKWKLDTESYAESLESERIGIKRWQSQYSFEQSRKQGMRVSMTICLNTQRRMTICLNTHRPRFYE